MALAALIFSILALFVGLYALGTVKKYADEVSKALQAHIVLMTRVSDTLSSMHNAQDEAVQQVEASMELLLKQAKDYYENNSSSLN